MDAYLAETLGLADWLWLRLVRRRVFFNNKTVAVRCAEALLAKLGCTIDEGEPLTIGALQKATGLRQKSYATARQTLAKMNVPAWHWTQRIGVLLGIDFSLVVEKYFFDELYRKYSFIDLALAYRAENPHGRNLLRLDADLIEPYVEELSQVPDLRIRSRSRYAAFLFSLLAIPLLPWFHRWRHGIGEARTYRNEIVCLVDDASTHEMFNSIFSTPSNVRFVAERHNALGHFSPETRTALGIATLGFTAAAFRNSVRQCFSYLRISLGRFKEIAAYGRHPALIFHALLQGRGLAIEGEGNLFVCFEHHTTVCAIRNEFLRAAGNESVFVPKNSYVTYQHFYSELFANYTVAGAAGPHAMDVYRRREARAKAYIAAGSYDRHRSLNKSPAANPRLQALRDFKGDSPMVVFLSPGVCPENYSHDKRLVELAGQLSRQAKVKVALRFKPVDRIRQYAGFYEEILKDAPDVLMTGGEYDLFDFVGIGDLFVTSQSTSACDLAVAGAQVMFVNFMQTPDLYAPWEKVPAAVFYAEQGLPAIQAWLENKGNERERHAETMRELSRYLGFAYDSFEAYRTNLLHSLAAYLPTQRGNLDTPMERAAA